VLAHHALNSSVWITIANHGLLICIWAYHAIVPPVHIVATSTTLLLTLPLPIARGYALIHLAYKIAKEREPLLAFISLSELSLWGLDMVTSCGIAAMVLNMNLGESQEKFISRSSTESFVDAGNSPEHAPLLHHNRDSPTPSTQMSRIPPLLIWNHPQAHLKLPSTPNSGKIWVIKDHLRRASQRYGIPSPTTGYQTSSNSALQNL
jgi:hypothetical protein